jgi:hypothetical protein
VTFPVEPAFEFVAHCAKDADHEQENDRAAAARITTLG